MSPPSLSTVYADWCGPCKVIAPTFESLSTKYSKPGKITFAKVNVDTQQEVARRHGVSAMPTFMVFKSGSVVETVRGANPPALTAAVEKGVRLATGAGGGAGPSGSSFGSPGQRLGSDPKVPARGPRRAPAWDFAGIIKAIFIFLGLYFVSLFSVSWIGTVPRARVFSWFCAFGLLPRRKSDR